MLNKCCFYIVLGLVPCSFSYRGTNQAKTFFEVVKIDDFLCGEGEMSKQGFDVVVEWIPHTFKATNHPL